MPLPKEAKWKPQYDKERKYLPVWERTFPRVHKAPDSSDNAHCKLCCKTLMPKMCILTAHSNVTDHLSWAGAALSTQLVFTQPSAVSDDVKRTELELAAAVCCHYSVSAVDHLSERITRNAEGSKLSKIRLHRKKCSKSITEVLSPALEDDFISDIRGKKYFILIDESTDIASDKHLCTCIRYFSDKVNSVMPACDRQSVRQSKLNEATVRQKQLELQEDKAQGPDDIHPAVLWNCADAVSKLLSLIHTRSLEEGVLPED